MKRDSASIPLLSISERAYTALLILYPVDFRQEYGTHMVQVFRDLCRDAYRQGGFWGLANWWATTLFDLVKSVIVEHRKEDFSMSRETYIRWTGWLCILGGIFFSACGFSLI